MMFSPLKEANSTAVLSNPSLNEVSSIAPLLKQSPQSDIPCQSLKEAKKEIMISFVIRI